MTIAPTSAQSAGHDQGRPVADRLSSYIAAVELEGSRFAQMAEGASLDPTIGACPGWSLRDLIRHLGEIHLWAATNVAFPKPRWLHVGQLTDLSSYWPDLACDWPSDADLVSWYRATNANLVEVLRSAPLDVAAFTFLPAPTPLTMWARRQASEIAVHRFDAEQAAGIVSHFEPTFAADMLDELLTGFTRLYKEVTTEVPRLLRVVASDVSDEWWVTLQPGGMTTARSGHGEHLTVTGTAADLYLALWNRTAGSSLEFTGDPNVLAVWRDSCRVVWER